VPTAEVCISTGSEIQSSRRCTRNTAWSSETWTDQNTTDLSQKVRSASWNITTSEFRINILHSSRWCMHAYVLPQFLSYRYICFIAIAFLVLTHSTVSRNKPPSLFRICNLWKNKEVWINQYLIVKGEGNLFLITLCSCYRNIILYFSYDYSLFTDLFRIFSEP
jgi:hypothetical protein